jgi:hypothetical protein
LRSLKIVKNAQKCSETLEVREAYLWNNSKNKENYRNNCVIHEKFVAVFPCNRETYSLSDEAQKGYVPVKVNSQTYYIEQMDLSSFAMAILDTTPNLIDADKWEEMEKSEYFTDACNKNSQAHLMKALQEPTISASIY